MKGVVSKLPRKLPRKAASLDERGFAKMLREAEKDPELAQAAADQLEQDPKALLLEVFRLSDRQRKAIENTPVEQLRFRAAGLVKRLREGKLKGIKYIPGPPDSVTEGASQ